MGLDLRPAMYALFVLGALAVTLVWGISALFSSDTIESKTRIEPTIRYVVVDNRLDSLYVYERPKTSLFRRIFR